MTTFGFSGTKQHQPMLPRCVLTDPAAPASHSPSRASPPGSPNSPTATKSIEPITRRLTTPMSSSRSRIRPTSLRQIHQRTRFSCRSTCISVPSRPLPRNTPFSQRWGRRSHTKSCRARYVPQSTESLRGILPDVTIAVSPCSMSPHHDLQSYGRSAAVPASALNGDDETARLVVGVPTFGEVAFRACHGLCSIPEIPQLFTGFV